MQPVRRHRNRDRRTDLWWSGLLLNGYVYIGWCADGHHILSTAIRDPLYRPREAKLALPWLADRQRRRAEITAKRRLRRLGNV